MQSSSNGGAYWSNTSDPSDIPGTDKDMIASDNDNSSPYVNHVYSAWSVNPSGINESVDFSWSENNGGSFSQPIDLENGWGQGANVQSGINGDVYVCWANYNNNQLPEQGLGFAKLTNGGQSLSSSNIVFPYTGIRTTSGPNPTFNNIRVNSFPSMAVDKSNGDHSGRIYVTYAEEVNSLAVIALRYSDNEGSTWSAPIILSSPNFRESFFPWISVDPTNGDIYVVYCAFDQTTGFSTDVYVAYSNNDGTSFQNIRVSDVPFITQPITGVPNLAPGYMGDYIGIAAYGGKAWAAWMDNRNGTW